MGCTEAELTEGRMVLAEEAGLGDVSMCGCGTVHLSVASMTLRMAPEVFAQMVRMCQRGADRLAVEAVMRTGVGLVTH